MAETAGPAGLLADLIDGGVAPIDAPFELVALLRLARECGQIEVPGPLPGAAARMRSRFAELQDGRSRHGGWAGGFSSRPLAERLAAGALVVAVAGGGASVTTGVTPLDAARATGEFVHSLVLNLDPRDGGGDNSPGGGGTPPVSATPAGGPEPSVTPSPGAATATAGVNGETPSPLAGGPGPTTAGPTGTPNLAATPRTTTPPAVTGMSTATSTPATQAPSGDRLPGSTEPPAGTATIEPSPAPGTPGATPTPDDDDTEEDASGDDDETPEPDGTPEEDDG